MYWFELHDILLVVASLKNPFVNFNILDYISFNNFGTRSTSSRKLKINPAHLSATRHFFLNHVARVWNAMPAVEITTSLLTTKRFLFVICGVTFWYILILTILVYFTTCAPVLHVLILMLITLATLDVSLINFMLPLYSFISFVGFTSTWCMSINLLYS